MNRRIGRVENIRKLFVERTWFGFSVGVLVKFGYGSFKQRIKEPFYKGLSRSRRSHSVLFCQNRRFAFLCRPAERRLRSFLPWTLASKSMLIIRALRLTKIGFANGYSADYKDSSGEEVWDISCRKMLLFRSLISKRKVYAAWLV